MEASKVILSGAEHRLIADVNVILTKNSALDKIVTLFSRLSADYQRITIPLKHSYPLVFDSYPKISKGEKHHDLPWVMLDYPRCFDKQGHLAIRSFFWWGNYFSIRLQVSGIYMKPFLNALPAWTAQNPEWYSGITNDAWNLQLPNPNWLEISHVNLPGKETFLKLAKKIPIDDWEDIETKFTNNFSELVALTAKALSSNPVQ